MVMAMQSKPAVMAIRFLSMEALSAMNNAECTAGELERCQRNFEDAQEKRSVAEDKVAELKLRVKVLNDSNTKSSLDCLDERTRNGDLQARINELELQVAAKDTANRELTAALNREMDKVGELLVECREMAGKLDAEAAVSAADQWLRFQAELAEDCGNARAWFLNGWVPTVFKKKTELIECLKGEPDDRPRYIIFPEPTAKPTAEAVLAALNDNQP